ncbi:MAG: divergent polysaccharide deacetylase family protein [Candidatus Schekmanbacteria bacterium]|nr:divergent polysaccharide deacetylase family protein [Candidatus Schekmanbacteria bacterium]
MSGSRRPARGRPASRKPARNWLGLVGTILVIEAFGLAFVDAVHYSLPGGMPLFFPARREATVATSSPVARARARALPAATARPVAVARLEAATATPTRAPAPAEEIARRRAAAPPADSARRRYLPGDAAPVAKIALVIDDFGHVWDVAERMIMDLSGISVSVLPHLAHSRRLGELAYEHGHDVLLHLPMEPTTYPRDNPGEGALFVAMDPSAILRATRRDLGAVPHVLGVNNHMGSRFTQDRRGMEQVLRELREGGYFFLDSVTAAGSVGYELAASLGLPAARRDVFIDNLDAEDAVRQQLDELVGVALRKGKAIGIGHVRGATYRAIKGYYEELGRRQVALVPVSELLDVPPARIVTRAAGCPQGTACVSKG